MANVRRLGIFRKWKMENGGWRMEDGAAGMGRFSRDAMSNVFETAKRAKEKRAENAEGSVIGVSVWRAQRSRCDGLRINFSGE
jgi:hypothetical protein